MCGIAGYKIDQKFDSKIIKQMVEALVHRGPDSEGYHSEDGYTAGMRRLKINDLKSGDQPLFNEKGDIILFYNGEIYNSPSLRIALEERGHSFKTNCDGEVICHLYEEYGSAVFEHLDGMFAIALWDQQKKCLLLARDLAGEKPLYYAMLGEKGLTFSSEIKSLVLFPGLDLTLNRQAVWDMPSFQWIPEPATVYQNIQAIPRGHFLVADSTEINLKSYPNKFADHQIALDDESVVAETRRIVEDSVKSRLLSDVPVGSFLSGGLDSSIVAAIASKNLDQLTTFCIAFEDISDPYHGKADESQDAAEFAGILGTVHHTIRVTAQDFRDLLPELCKYGDQPFSVSSGLGILAVARAARQEDIKVLLSGDGADEGFGGYSWYSHLGIDSMDAVPNGDQSTVSFQNFGMDIDERLAILAGYSADKRAWAYHYYAAEEEKQELFNHEYFEGITDSHRFFREFKAGEKWKPIDFVRQDRQFYFPFEMMRKLDRLTMAYSVEGRVPFASPMVLNHVEKLKFNHLVRGNTLKWALREAFTDLLPPSITGRPKHGFNVPIDHWLKGEWADLLEETFSVNSALYKCGMIHQKSREIALKMVFDKNRLNGHSIFCLIILNLWLEGSI